MPWSAEKILNGLAVGVMVVLLGACAPRGAVSYVDPQDAANSTKREIFWATSRDIDPQTNRVTAGRAPGLNFGRQTIAIPPAHEIGAVEWPGRQTPDPDKHFVTTSRSDFKDARSFSSAFNTALKPRSIRGQSVVVFVHGFNVNFPEGLYRLAQMAHDLDMQEQPVLFSWASGGTPLGYVYDRDSAAIARDRLVEFLRVLSDSNAREIVLVAHSMGSYLMMETLRQLAITGDKKLLGQIDGVFLLAPDIDVTLFRAQTAAIGTLPQPFVIYTSSKDQALGLSARITGQSARLGSLQDLSLIEDLPVSIIDGSNLEDGDSLRHGTAFTSPTMLNLVTSLPVVGEFIQEDRNDLLELLPGQFTRLQRATGIVLRPN